MLNCQIEKDRKTHSRTQYTSRTAGEVRINLKVMFSLGLLRMDVSVLAEKQILTYISSVWTLGVG